MRILYFYHTLSYADFVRRDATYNVRRRAPSLRTSAYAELSYDRLFTPVRRAYIGAHAGDLPQNLHGMHTLAGLSPECTPVGTVREVVL